MLNLSSLPVLVHQLMKVIPGPLNYCLLEAAVSDMGNFAALGETASGQKSLTFMGEPLLCHWSEMSVKTSGTLPFCHFLHPNVFMVPWQAFSVGRASRSSCFPESQCQTAFAAHLAPCVYEKAVVFVYDSF